MFAFMGRGFTVRERTVGSDMAPYMSVKALDPKFYDYSIPWIAEKPPTKESARLATAEEPPATPGLPAKRIHVLQANGPDGLEEKNQIAGATRVEMDEIGQSVDVNL